MKGISFPIVKTKGSSGKVYDLNLPSERAVYFEEKVGREISDLKKYFESNTFIAYMLGKKQAGKGTYAKLFMEIFGNDSAVHVSVGDVVRAADEVKSDPKKLEELREYMKNNYRGFMSLDDAFNAFLGRDVSKLCPTEFVLELVKREIDKHKGKILFIDGFPRSMDQVSYALYFRQLINYTNDPDLFIFIDLPEQVIDERMKGRVVCPKCNSSKNVYLNVTKYVDYDEKLKTPYLLCDNPNCEALRMVGKEGDDKGIELIRDRLEADDNLIRNAMKLYGIPKVYLRNSIPVDGALELVDEYELTKARVYSYDEQKKKLTWKETEWVVKDDDGNDSYSLYAASVVVGLIKQLHELLIK